MIRALIMVALASLPVRADDTDLVRARAHFEAGRAFYTLGRYEEALPEFVAGYQLLPRAEFLLDIAQCHRRLGHVAQARTMYQQFLLEAQEGDPHIAEARRLLSELPASPPSPPPQPAVQAAAPAQVVVVAPPPRRSFWRRHWWILPTAGVVLAGVGVGIYFGTRPLPSVNCGSVGLGCVDARGP